MSAFSRQKVKKELFLGVRRPILLCYWLLTPAEGITLEDQYFYAIGF